MEIFENLFVSSYAFQSNYNEREWVCPEQEFLDKLTDFKKETERGNFNIIKDTKENAKDTILRSDDIGEIISDNVKLFENTDIDSVLPDKEKI